MFNRVQTFRFDRFKTNEKEKSVAENGTEDKPSKMEVDNTEAAAVESSA